jgi:hypothetical protein
MVNIVIYIDINNIQIMTRITYLHVYLGLNGPADLNKINPVCYYGFCVIPSPVRISGCKCLQGISPLGSLCSTMWIFGIYFYAFLNKVYTVCFVPTHLN